MYIVQYREARFNDSNGINIAFSQGCNFYCEAKVDDPTWILVSIGMGFFLEMTLPEALEYIRNGLCVI